MPSGAARVVLGIVLCAVFPMFAQDLDSNMTAEHRSTAVIADQIQDPVERAAFLVLFKKSLPSELKEEAAAFLGKYPQSAFLAQVLEIAARSSFDTGDLGSGLDYGRRSIQLLPENPLLLVAMADVEAGASENSDAVRNASEALVYLDRFARPSSISERDWPDVKRRQRATAYFVIGRARLQQALKEKPGEVRREHLNESEQALIEAKSLNREDQEAAYLLGMNHLSQGKLDIAASEFADIYVSVGAYSTRASDALQEIYNARPHQLGQSFSAFVQAVRGGESLAVPAVHKAHAGETRRWEYAGSQACKSCHEGIYENWSQSGMANMLRPYQPQNVIGDFRKTNEYYIGDDVQYVHGTMSTKSGIDRSLFAKMTTRDGRHFFEIKQSDGRWHTYPIDYTIGSKWQQAYATKLPNGQIHVFPIQYNVMRKEWLNYWKSLDGDGTERSDPRNWERLDEATSYQAKCAICHTSQLRNTAGGGMDSDNIVFREPGIGCEMCHGPSSHHIKAISEGEAYEKKPIEPPVQFNKITNRDFVNICGQCHMQSALRDTGAHGELNYSDMGDSGRFFRESLSVPFGEFTRKGFYKDGRFSQSTFIVEALERSQCFRKGQASCGNCHDPHSHDFSQNQTSLKFKNQPDKMCTGCHSQFLDTANAAAHTHHSLNSEGSRCVSCHMPKIMDALAFSARTHQIDDIPNAEMTARFGQRESPNACLLCHTNKNVAWLKDQLALWKKPPLTETAAK